MHASASRITTVIVAGLFALTSCGSDDAPATNVDGSSAQASDAAAISFVDTWSREPVTGQSSSAVYGRIVNEGDEDVTATAARTSLTDRAELHEVLVGDDGAMTMQQREGGFVVPAGGELVLEPGSFHVMLLDIDPDTYPASVELELEFDDGTTLDVMAEVRAVDGDMDMEMDDDS